MFSPRTHRRQNSAETSYQKGKSPYYSSFLLFFPSFYQLLLQGGEGEGARQFSRCNTLRPRRGTGSTKLFNLFLHQLHTRKEMIPSIYDESIRNTYSRISRISSLTLRNVVLLHYALRRIAFLNHRVGE